MNIFELIELICEDYRQQCKAGKRPRIEDHLAKVPDTARSQLFRNLLQLDIRSRRALEENPKSGDYIQRFPDYSKVIRQAFYESTLESFAQTDSTPSIAPTKEYHSTARRLGEYELGRKLGEGGFGIVYEARHVRRGDRVALKTLPRESVSIDGADEAADCKQRSGDRLLRFKREFRTLVDMHHPNLVGLHSLEADGDQWFFTMDLIQGVDFFDYVRPHGRLNEARLRAVVPQLVAGVSALHNQGIIHRDLKPSNVMVTNGGQVLILDFGLVAELEKRADTASIAHFAGTPVYAAPEQLWGDHSAASDWYAVGVMIYEALCGVRPFAETGVRVLDVKANQDPLPLPESKSLPEDLAELAIRLLNRDVTQRLDAIETAHALSGRVIVDRPRQIQSTGSLIGRESHLAQLHSALDSLRQTGHAQIVFVSGHSGEGKTSLVECFLDPLRTDRDVVVLSGRCYDRESVPFKAIDGVIDALCAYLRKLPESDAALLMPDDLAFLTQVFPVLQRVEVIARADTPNVGSLDRPQVLTRAFAALRLLLSRLAKRQPIVIFTDDLQWGDASSADALHAVLSGEDTPSILLIGTYRSDEAEQSRFLNRWSQLHGDHASGSPAEHIGLAPLTAEDCKRLMVDILKRDNAIIDQQAVKFYGRTDGNPYLLMELIRCFDLNADDSAALSLPDVLQRKLTRLPELASRLLEIIAVSGRAVAMQEVFGAAAAESIDAGIINHMRSENLVRLVGTDNDALLDTYHDTIREAVIEQLSQDDLRATHRALAVQIEQESGNDPTALYESLQTCSRLDRDEITAARSGDLAYHYEAAGNSTRALTYAVLAAESARRQFAFDVASEFYSMAQRHLDSASNRLRYRVAAGHGESLIQSGRFAEALTILQGTAKLTDDRIEKATVDMLRGNAIYRLGNLNESVRVYDDVLEYLGEPVPAPGLRFGLATLCEFGAWYARYLAPNLAFRRKRGADDRMRLYLKVSTATLLPLFFSDSPRCLHRLLALSNACVGYEDATIRMNRMYWDWYLCWLIGLHGGIAARWSKIKADLASVDATLTMNFLRWSALGWIRSGALAQSLDELNEADEILSTKVQDFWASAMTEYWISETQFRMGNLSDSGKLSRHAFETSLGAGQDRLAQQALATLTFACGGHLPFDELASCYRTNDEDVAGAIQIKLAESMWHLAYGRTTQAMHAVEGAHRLLKQTWMVTNPFTTAVLPMKARVLREHALALQKTDAASARKLLSRALRTARLALRCKRFFPSETAISHREYALCLDLRGRCRRALKHAQRSCHIAEQQGARYELAQSRLVVAELSQKLGLPAADKLLVEAKKGMGEFKHMLKNNAAMWKEISADVRRSSAN